MATTGVPNQLYQGTDAPDLVGGAFANHTHEVAYEYYKSRSPSPICCIKLDEKTSFISLAYHMDGEIAANSSIHANAIIPFDSGLSTPYFSGVGSIEYLFSGQPDSKPHLTPCRVVCEAGGGQIMVDATGVAEDNVSIQRLFVCGMLFQV